MLPQIAGCLRNSPALQIRMGTSEEMAKVVAFLASDDASFVSGSGVLADGGYTVA
jgi:NAD(P)-dependent dehydrogenase (short-subunit alcohol dehydrogenase family)